MVLVGTAGFSYSDWKGTFYPPNIPTYRMLEYYAQHFPVLELDYTYYSMPSQKSMSSFVKRTPANFRISLKAHRSMTHQRGSPQEVREAFSGFMKALTPLMAEGKLACILAQFPWSFKPSGESRGTLELLREHTEPAPVVVEFRNSAWVSDDTFELLRRLGLGFCCVDEPRLPGLMPPVCVATSQLGYVRFHGRNAQAWWKPGAAGERYNYLYSQDELEEWKGRIMELDQTVPVTLVLFNNCHGGNAAVNAKMLQTMLGRGE
ncbi:MAG: DUF72 domain-containing protein [Bacillota bacterium]